VLLQVVVWGTQEWYEKARPRLDDAGFVEVPERAWADAATDGERIGVVFDVGQDLPWDRAAAALDEVRRILTADDGPPVEISLVR
jgi:hypothetical protein